MVIPGILAIVSPVIVGFIFGPETLGGLLAGVTVTGVLMAIFQSNSGGAWELVARVSHLDLNNVDIQGGSIDTFSIGANYYMTNDLRFVLNYVMADSDDFAGDDDPNTWAFRIRWTF